MIKETGRVISLEADGVWVETIQRSACHSCTVQKGCGQGALARFAGKPAAIRALPGECDLQKFKPDDDVVIGIPEDVIVRGTLLIYLLPLVLLVAGASFANYLSGSDWAIALGAALGLVVGGFAARFHSAINKNNCRIQPVLLGKATP